MTHDSDENKKNDNPEPDTATPQPNLPPHLRAMVQQTDQAVAKTKLDYDAVEDVVKQISVKKEEQLAEIIADQMYTAEPGAPVKMPENPVNDFQLCSPCNVTTTTKDRVGFCERCHSRFYDLSGMQMPEVKDLIFKMEGTNEFKLWKRSDGRFMTRDCSVGRSRKFINLTLAGCAVLITLAAMFLLVAAPRSAPPLPTQTETADQAATAADSSTGDSSERPRRRHRIRVRKF